MGHRPSTQDQPSPGVNREKIFRFKKGPGVNLNQDRGRRSRSQSSENHPRRKSTDASGTANPWRLLKRNGLVLFGCDNKRPFLNARSGAAFDRKPMFDSAI